MRGKKIVLSLAVLGGLGGAGLWRSWYERGHFVTEEVRIPSKKIKEPKTLVFLTDLHDKEFGRGNRELLSAIGALEPDMALIGGDTMIAKPGKAALDLTERLLDGLTKICPVFYGNGNHEQRLNRERGLYGGLYDQFCLLLEQYGVRYLNDASADAGEDLCISGLNLDNGYYRNLSPDRMDQEYMKCHLGMADSGRFQILMAHSPMFFDAYAQWGADLTLAGHFHGGTIRIPGLGGLMTPQYQFFLPYCAGDFEKNEHRMIVGRGLGTHSVNIRLGNRPQLMAVRLLPEEG